MVCAIGFVDFNGAIKGWRQKYPELEKYFVKVDEIESFKSTRPVMFDLKTESVL